MAKINLAQMFTGGGDAGAPIAPRQMQLAQMLMSKQAPASIPTVGAGLAHVAEKAFGGFLAGRDDRRLAAEEEEEGRLMAGLAQIMLGDTGAADLPATGAEPSVGVAPAPGMGEGDFVSQSGGTPAPAPAQSFGGNQQEFISSIMPYAMEVSQQTGVDPRIIVAQAALESGWGKSAPGNNFFGIKSHGKPGGQTLATNEVVNGQTQRINDSFRTFGSMGDSVRGYGEFLQQNPRYRPMLQAQGLDAQIDELARSGYATDPNYGRKIRSIAGGIQMPQAAADMPAPGAPPSMGLAAPALDRGELRGVDPASLTMNPVDQSELGGVDPRSLAMPMGQMLQEPTAESEAAGEQRMLARMLQEQQGPSTQMVAPPPQVGMMPIGSQTNLEQAAMNAQMIRPGMDPQAINGAPMPPNAPGGIVEQALARQGGAPPMDVAPPQAAYAAGGVSQGALMPQQQMIDPNQYAGGDWIPPDVGRQLAAQQMQQAGQPVPQRLAQALMGDQAPQAAMTSMGGVMPPQPGMPPQGMPQGAQQPSAQPNMDAILQQALQNPRTRGVAIQILQQRQAAQEKARQQQLSVEAARAAGIDPRFLGDDKIAGAAATAQFREQPTSIREYEYAKSQGYGGSFAQFEQEQRKAGATNVIQNAGQTDEFYGNLDKKSGDSFAAIYDAGVNANSKLAQIDRMETLLSSAPQGATGALTQIAGNFGINVEGLSEVQAATALINQLVPQQRQPGSGPMSDADLALFKQSLPRIINQPDGNRIIINTMRSIAQYEQQQGQIAAQVMNRQISPADGRKALMELQNPLSFLNDVNPPAGALELLKSDPSPEAQREFDEEFGPGAAARALGGR